MVDTLARARAAVPAPTPKQTSKLAEADASVSQGRALRWTPNPAGAVAAFRDSVGKSLSAR